MITGGPGRSGGRGSRRTATGRTSRSRPIPHGLAPEEATRRACATRPMLGRNGEETTRFKGPVLPDAFSSSGLDHRDVNPSISALGFAHPLAGTGLFWLREEAYVTRARWALAATAATAATASSCSTASSPTSPATRPCRSTSASTTTDHGLPVGIRALGRFGDEAIVLRLAASWSAPGPGRRTGQRRAR